MFIPVKTAQWPSAQRMRYKDFGRTKWLTAVVDFPKVIELNDSETSHFPGVVTLKKIIHQFADASYTVLAYGKTYFWAYN